jgi:translation initiation factor IF-2
MTTPADTSNKNQRRVLTIKSPTGNSTTTNNIPRDNKNVAGVQKQQDKRSHHQDRRTRPQPRSLDDIFSVDRKKMRDLSGLDRAAKEAIIIPVIAEIPVVEEKKVTVVESKEKKNPSQQRRDERPRHYQQHHRKRNTDVNFDQNAKKVLKVLDNKPKKDEVKIEEKKVEEKKITTVPPSIKPLEVNRGKVVHGKQKSQFNDDDSTNKNKAKVEQQNRHFKISATHIAKIEGGEDDLFQRSRNKKRRNHVEQKQVQEKVLRDITIGEAISVSDLAMKISEKSSTVIKSLMKMGMMVTVNQVVDGDTAELVATELGHRVTRVTEDSMIRDLIGGMVEVEGIPEKRSPIVTVMGHVDHGKTSLLDALRKTDVAAREHGGITQHIGAHELHLPNGDSITFLDTPGHEAFSAMRIRGAKVTDMIILVVAADDGIKAQTIEAISHAKAAAVPIIVAVNKMDKPTANFDYVKNSLLQYDIIPDDMGGDVMVVGISALSGLGLNELLDAILLQADLLNLKATHHGRAKGYVVEARLDKIKGFTASLLIQSGQLNVGDIVVAGQICGRIRSMYNDKGKSIQCAGPSVPVEITGMDGVPVAGDEFIVMQNEKAARELVEMLSIKAQVTTGAKPKTLQEMFHASREDTKEIAIIVKADVHGSAEAILQSLNKIKSDEVKVRVIHYGAGGINESDIMLAAASKALIVGFNVRPNANAKDMASKVGVKMKFYSIIYNLLDDVKAIMSDALSPIEREVILGLVEIRKVFETSKYGKIGGCYVKEGLVRRNSLVRLIRDNGVISTTTIKSLQRQKDDAKEVKEGFECGITLDHYDDIRTGDQLEIFEIVSEKQTL